MEHSNNVIFDVLNYYGLLSFIPGTFILLASFIFIQVILKERYKQILMSIFILYTLFIFFDRDIQTIRKYFKIRDIYKNKEYKELVGVVNNYKSIVTQGICYHESFSIDNVDFLYDSCVLTAGLNKPKSVKNGMKVKIRYIKESSFYSKKIILYLERLN